MASHIDPKIPDNELEWFTKRRCVTVLVGLLVKIEGLEEVSMPIQQVIANTQTALPQTTPQPSAALPQITPQPLAILPQTTMQPLPAKVEPENKETERREPESTPHKPVLTRQPASPQTYPEQERKVQSTCTCSIL